MTFTKQAQARRKASAHQRPKSRDRLASNSTLRVPEKQMAAMSPKRKRYYDTSYRPLVEAAVGDGREPCQIQSPVCTGFVEHVHEALPRGRAGGLEAAVRDGLKFPACDACNSYCSQEGQVWARERGFLISRKPRIEGVG